MPNNITMWIAAGATATCAVLGVAGAGVAAADVQASGGANTTVDKDGTQGDLKPAVQGKQDDDGDQDAYSTRSSQAVPQYKGG